MFMKRNNQSQGTSSTDQQKKTHFPKIDAQQHFVRLIFQQNKILSNQQQFNISSDHKLRLISTPHNHFIVSFIESQVSGIIYINRPKFTVSILFFLES